MYKNLSPQSLGITGRQSELIELALTYHYHGLSIDMVQFAELAEKRGFEPAYQYLESAKMNIGGFELPVRWQGEEEEYKTDLERLGAIAAIAKQIGATGCHTTVMAGSDVLPYHENFEFHRGRFSEIADVLAPHDIRLGLDFLATAESREGFQHTFISAPDALVTLMKTIGVANVGVVVDLWHWKVGGGTVEHLSQLTPEQIIMVCVAEVPEEVEPHAAKLDQREMPGDPPSEYLVSAMNTLGKMGYDGPVTPTPTVESGSGKTRDRIVSAAGKATERLWMDADITKSGEYSPEEVALIREEEAARAAAREAALAKAAAAT